MTASKLSPNPSAMAGRSRPLLIESSEDLLESLPERRIQEPEARSAESDVGEHGIGQQVVREDRTNHESGGDRGYAQDTQWTDRKTRECSRELIQRDRIVVHEEIPAARFTVLGEMYE